MGKWVKTMNDATIKSPFIGWTAHSQVLHCVLHELREWGVGLADPAKAQEIALHWWVPWQNLIVQADITRVVVEWKACDHTPCWQSCHRSDFHLQVTMANTLDLEACVTLLRPGKANCQTLCVPWQIGNRIAVGHRQKTGLYGNRSVVIGRCYYRRWVRPPAPPPPHCITVGDYPDDSFSFYSMPRSGCAAMT